MKRIKLSDLSVETIEKNKNKKVKAASEITLRASVKEIPNEYWDKVEVESDWDREYVESANFIGHNRGGTTYGGAKEIPMMESSDIPSRWNRKFRNQRDLDNFKKYTEGLGERTLNVGWGRNPKIKDIRLTGTGNAAQPGAPGIKDTIAVTRPSLLTQYLKEANQMFHSRGYGRLREREAFEYLKSIISYLEVKADIKFTPNQEFTLGEWDKWKSNVRGEIEVSEQEAQEWQQCSITEHQQLQSQLTAAQLQNTQLQNDKNTLQKEKEALQNQLNEFNALLGITTSQSQMEAQVQQVSNLLPGKNN